MGRKVGRGVGSGCKVAKGVGVKHPMQYKHTPKGDRERFVKNEVVAWLLDNAYDKNGQKIDMNTLAVQSFNVEDRRQFAQLIGYSVGGYGELSYVDNASYAMAEAKNPEAMRISYHEALVKKMRNELRESMAELFDVHPDDLRGDA